MKLDPRSGSVQSRVAARQFITPIQACCGAYATNMTLDNRHGLIFVWMVQHANFPADGAKSREAFMQAAKAEFAK